MVAYEFYLVDEIKRHELLGILPERRKNPERITHKSVMGWAEKIFGRSLNTRNIHFIQVTINEYTGNVSRPTPFLVTQWKAKK